MVIVFLLSRTKRDCFFSSHTFLYNDYLFHTIPWRIWPLEMLMMLTIEKIIISAQLSVKAGTDVRSTFRKKQACSLRDSRMK